jgi:hypothetical protein
VSLKRFRGMEYALIQSFYGNAVGGKRGKFMKKGRKKWRKVCGIFEGLRGNNSVLNDVCVMGNVFCCG